MGKTILQIIILVLSLSELTEQLINIGDFYLSIPRILLIIIIFLAFATVSVKKVSFKYYTPVLFPMFLLIVFQFVSVFVSPDLLYSFKRWLNYFTLFLLPIIISVLSPSIYSSIGLSISTIYNNTKNAAYVSIPILLVVSIYQIVTLNFVNRVEFRTLFNISFLRIDALFYDPNFLASYLVFVSAFISPTFFDLKNLRWYAKEGLAFVIVLILVFLTGSRGGIIALLFCTTVKLMINGNYSSFILNKKFAFLVSMFPIVVIGSVYLKFSILTSSIHGFDDESLSALSRALSWYAGISLFLENSIFGVGPGNFVTMNKASYLPSGVAEPWRIDKINELAGHCNILELFVESGFFAGFSYMLLFYAVTKVFFELRKKADLKLVIYVDNYWISILGFYITTTFVTYFPIWFFFCFGLFLIQLRIMATKVDNVVIG